MQRVIHVGYRYTVQIIILTILGTFKVSSLPVKEIHHPPQLVQSSDTPTLSALTLAGEQTGGEVFGTHKTVLNKPYKCIQNFITQLC